MPGLQRHYEVWCGEQFSGKTHQLRRRIRVLEGKRRISAVFVCDTKNEFGDLGVVVRSFGEYINASEEGIPRVVVWQMGEDAEYYDIVFREAIETGGCVLVLDEAYTFAQAGTVWKSARLKRIVLSGRHLTNAKGDECVTHLLVASQYPKSIHHQLWSQARTIMCGKISGELAREWVRGNFGKPALVDVDALEMWEWKRLRGDAPELGEDRW